MGNDLTRQEREDFTWYTLLFVFACIVYSIIGFSWGAFMGGMKSFRDFVDYSAYGQKIVLAHTHVNLLGWVEMAIFGALYYVVPKLTNGRIYSVKLVKVHFWMHNIGLVGLVVFFTLAGMAPLITAANDPDVSSKVYHRMMALTGPFGTLVLLANIIWGYNLLRTAMGWRERMAK